MEKNNFFEVISLKKCGFHRFHRQKGPLRQELPRLGRVCPKAKNAKRLHRLGAAFMLSYLFEITG